MGNQCFTVMDRGCHQIRMPIKRHKTTKYSRGSFLHDDQETQLQSVVHAVASIYPARAKSHSPFVRPPPPLPLHCVNPPPPKHGVAEEEQEDDSDVEKEWEEIKKVTMSKYRHSMVADAKVRLGNLTENERSIAKPVSTETRNRATLLQPKLDADDYESPRSPFSPKTRSPFSPKAAK